MAEDPTNPSVLYSGSEFGLFVSPDRGGRWTRIKSNLPTVPIHEIVIHPRDNDMILATHGRSIWILDDATPIQQAAEATRGEAFLFDSDMEWDIGLPWYREVRTAHQVLNGNYGYRNGSGKYPAYYIDSLPPTRDVGRGSPVGSDRINCHERPYRSWIHP